MIAGVLGLATGLAMAAPAHAGQAVVTFSQPGDVTVLAPAGVTGVDVRLEGGAGGTGGALLGVPGAGGAGALISGHLATDPGSPLEHDPHCTPGLIGPGSEFGTYTLMPYSGSVPFGASTVPVILASRFGSSSAAWMSSYSMVSRRSTRASSSRPSS